MELQDARRERRRKILENSKYRLAKISGNTIDGNKIEGMATFTHYYTQNQRLYLPKYFLLDVPPKCNIIYPDPELEREDPISNNFAMPTEFNGVGMIDPQTIFNMLNGQNTTNDESLDSNALNLLLHPKHSFMPTLNNTLKQPTLPKLANFLQSKIHISLLVLWTYGLIVTETWPTDNVFLLFLLWELAENLVLRTYEVKTTSILTILLLLAGIPATYSTVMLKWFELANKVVRDVAIFVFFFVCVHVLWELFIVGKTLNIILEVDEEYFLRTQSTHI